MNRFVAEARPIQPGGEPPCDWSQFVDIAVHLTERVPGLAMARVVSGRAGFLEITANEDPIVGWTDPENVCTATDFSGHGISIAPGLAVEVARDLQGIAPTVDLSSYRFRCDE